MPNFSNFLIAYIGWIKFQIGPRGAETKRYLRSYTRQSPSKILWCVFENSSAVSKL